MSCFSDHDAVRKAIQEALPDWDNRGEDVNLPAGFTYLPQGHALALDPEVTIVSGIRGAGKSHWYSHFAQPEIREYLVRSYRNLRITTATDIFQGFGAGTGEKTPSPETMKRLLAEDPDTAWRAVLGSAIALPKPFPSSGNWDARLSWIRKNPEGFEKLMREYDESHLHDKKSVLVLFDALDRIADDWGSIRPAAKSLFRLALSVRSYRSIRMKLFVRPDMLEDDAIMNFPDASKLKASMGDLVWNRVDLYALLFQRLGNTRPFGNQFVGYMRKTMRLEWEKAPDGKSRVLPESLRHDEELQADLFHEITGPTMAGGASGHKRGIPYSWLVNHLMDARGQVSPRSFFAALVTASQSKESKAWKFPLDYKAIWNGVQKASQIRKNEIALEDYPWVSFLMDPLGARKLTIPCEESEIRGVWEEDKVIENLIKRINSGNEPVKLPPRRINDGARGLIEDLVGLGIMYRLPDRRIQIPDVFRIAYGLGRKGGVRPLK